MKNLEAELKRLIIGIFERERMNPGRIALEDASFGEALGQDSIHALELGVVLKKNYSIYIDTHSTRLAEHFASAKNLAGFVVSQLETTIV